MKQSEESSTGSHTIEFVTTPAFRMGTLRHLLMSRRNSLLGMLALALFTVVMGITSGNGLLLGGSIVLLVIVLAIVPITMARHRSYYRKVGDLPTLITLDDEGIGIAAESGSARYGWPTISKVIRGEDQWVFFLANSRGTIGVPAALVTPEMRATVDEHVGKR